MRLLYLCHRLPHPPDKGDKIRSHHQVLGLARRHEVSVFTTADEGADPSAAAELARFVRRVVCLPNSGWSKRLRAVCGLLRREALSVAAFDVRALRRRIARSLAQEPFDAAVVYSSNALPLLGSFAGPLVVDLVDVDSAKWEGYAEEAGALLRPLYAREARLVRRLEQEAARRADCVLVCAERELTELRRIARPRRAVVVPNGTDTNYFSPGPSDIDPFEVVFTGAMDYAANVDAVLWFARVVWPRVRAVRDRARFFVVGSNPARSVRRLSGRDGIVVTGRVPDVRPYLRAAATAVAPLRVARGIQNKVLEALACGVPVVATGAALGGIGANEGCVPADSAEEFAAALLRLLDDEGERRRRGDAGRRYVVERFRWERHVARLEEEIERAVARRGAREVPA